MVSHLLETLSDMTTKEGVGMATLLLLFNFRASTLAHSKSW